MDFFQKLRSSGRNYERIFLIGRLKEKVIEGKTLSKDDVLSLVDSDIDELCSAANGIRIKFCGQRFEICAIINAKSGRCSEDCKYCAQSAHYKVEIEQYPLLNSETIFAAAKKEADSGVQRFSPVVSGKRLNSYEIESLCEALKKIKSETDLKICASCGLLTHDDLQKLKDAGLSRYHNNLESSESFFRKVCSTHTTQDKLETIKSAKMLGLEICSGGIIGLGESWEDRIDMAFMLNRLEVASIPVNILNPIPGTPYENNKKLDTDEVCRVCAIFRFINPKAFIRLAGGRRLLEDNGRRCLQSGANALISGDMLTTAGISVEQDLKMVRQLGFDVKQRDFCDRNGNRYR